MAFSNAPQYNTYKQETVPFDGLPMYRAGDLTDQRDLQIVNMYYDRVSQENKEREVRLKKRPGLVASSYSLSKVSSSDTIRGYYYDVDQNAFYWAVGNKLYAVKPDVGTSIRTVATLNTSTGLCAFASFLKSDDTRYVMMADGTDLWIDNYATTTCTRVTDVDMPTPHEPTIVYLNGYVFLIEKNSGNIWNSDVDDPFSWTANSYITAEISSDYALRLLKAKNYLIALGYNSAEYFWDAGNASGSPLSRNDSPVRGVGYVSNLCTIGDTTYFVGQDEKKNLGVYAINSFKIDRVSNSVVDRTLQAFNTTSNAKGNVSLAKDGHCVSVDGHSFYVLVTPQTTWMYDVDDRLWYEWKGSDGSGLNVEASWGMYNGHSYVAIANQSNISFFSQKAYQDFGANFTCRYTTEPTDFNTFNWKVANKVMLLCSRHTNTGTSNVTLSWSDDDWGSTTGTRNVNIFSVSPYVTRLGKFRTRSWRIQYADNYPFWITGMQLNLNVGSI